MDSVRIAAANELSNKLTSPNGRYEVGQTMLEPFKEGRDYVSIGRKILAVHHLEPGAPAWYDIDAQFSATVIGSNGGAPRVLDGQSFDRVEVTHFPISVLVRIGVQEPAIRRFDVLDREQVRAQAEMAKQEDLNIFQCIRTGATTGSGISDGVAVPTNPVTAAFSLDLLAQLFGNLEQACDSNVENLLIRNDSMRYIRNLSDTTRAFDPVTRRELLKTGYMGDLWGAQVRTSRLIQSKEFLAVASPEYVGVFSVRIDLSQMDAPLAENLQYGWLLYSYSAPAILTNVGCNRLIVS